MADVTEKERGTADRGLPARSDSTAQPAVDRGLTNKSETPAEIERRALETAIELFRASPTSRTSEGKAVLTKLDALLKAGKISFVELPLGLYGESSPSADTITMSKHLITDPATSSIWLVHEAYHLAGLGTKLYIDEEIHSRELQARYSRLLAQGITVADKIYRSKPDNLSEVYAKNQIVDWVLSNPDYADKQGFLTLGWVIEHIGDWGGSGNRSTLTRDKYLDLLLEKPRLEYLASGARALFALLESASVFQARNSIVRAGGGDFNAGAKRIRERIEPATNFGGPTDTLRDRIVAWQQRTGLDLGFAPLPASKR